MKTQDKNTGRRARLGLVSALLLVTAQSAWAADISLNFISFTSLPDEGVELHLTFSDTPPQPSTSTAANPATITLDLPKVVNNLPWSLPLPIEVGAAQTVSAAEASGNTRVVINLSRVVAYETRASGNSIYVTLANAASGEQVPEGAAPEMSTTTETPPAEAAPNDAEVMTAPSAPAMMASPTLEAPPATNQAPKKAALKTAAAKPEPAAAEPMVQEDTAMDMEPVARLKGNSLLNISTNTLPGDRAQITLEFAQAPEKPSSFTIDNPARIALDFPNTTSKLPWRTRNVGIGLTRSITAVESGGRTRVVLNLVKLLPYETRIENNTIAITLKGDLVQKQRGGALSSMNTGPTYSIEDIDFRRGEKGEGRVLISLSDPTISIDTREQGNRVIVEFANTHIANELIQRLDVLDFATPVQFIDTSAADDQVRMVITPNGYFEFLAFQSEKTFTVEFKPLSKEQVEGKKEKENLYKGDTLSLNFQDIEVRAVLQLLADFTGLNIVTSDSVSGNLTLRLQNVPWDQALDIILKSKGLGMRKNGNVLMVAPQEEIASREQLELESKKQVEELAPLQSELIQVNYAKASDLAGLIQSQDNSMLSERGKVTTDDRTNTILVLETSDRLEQINQLISKLDVPVRQVLIESRIVVANNDFAKNLGVRFGVTGMRTAGADLIFASGSTNGTDTMWSSLVDTGTVSVPAGEGGIGDRLNVNMPVNGGGSVAFSVLGPGTLLDLELSALQNEGRGEVISSPRVITSNQTEAIIKQGTEIPFQEATSSGASSVAFKEAVLSLKVTPSITPDDRIRMDLQVTKDSVGQIVPTAEGGSAPSIDTREIQTQVLVASGETIVLGGIHEQLRRKDQAKVPFFGDLPFIGALFRTKRELDNNSELLIFVTPKILKDSLKLH